MSKIKKTVLMLVAYASTIKNNPEATLAFKQSEFAKFNELWLTTTQSVRNEFIRSYPDLFDKINDFRFKEQHPAYAIALRYHEQAEE